MAARVLACALLVLQVAPLCAARTRVHPGTIKDCGTEISLTDARATAWASSEGDDEQDCPRYKTLIDYDDSVRGVFEVNISRGYATFLMTYCKQNYVSRVEENNKNDRDETRILPDPVLLCSRSERESATYASSAVAQVHSTTTSNLSYLRGVDREQFENAIRQQPAAVQEMLASFTRGANSSALFDKQQQLSAIDVVSPMIQRTDVATAVNIVVRDLESNLRYFRTALIQLDNALNKYPELKKFAATMPIQGRAKGLQEVEPLAKKRKSWWRWW